jgi:hypothetical protein
MIKKGITKATFMGGVLVMILTLVIGLVLEIIFLPVLFSSMTYLLLDIVGLAITGFIAGAITVYIIMKQTIKQFMPLIQSLLPKPKK